MEEIKKKLREQIKSKRKKLKSNEKVKYLQDIRKNYSEELTGISKDNLLNSDIDPKVEYLQTLPQHEQRTESWYKARKLLITASEAASVLFKNYDTTKNYINFYELQNFEIDPLKGCNPYMKLNEFYRKKCGEIPFTGNIATRHGQKYEDVAIGVYSRLFQKEIIEFGLIQHPELDWLGASPDGISKDGIMLEIKCPFRRKITGVAPFYYWVQVQLQLEVCNLEYCDFLECIFDNSFEWSTEKQFLDEKDEGLVKEEIFNKHSSQKKQFEGNTLKKGLIILQRPRKDKAYEFDSFYYPPSNMSDPEELLNWAENKIKEVKAALTIQNAWVYYKTGVYLHNFTIKPIFWRLTDIHVSRIKRDREWFSKISPTMYSAFKKMQWYQKNGTLTIQPKKKNTKTIFTNSKSNSKPKSNQVCLLLSDSD